jgi:hypothetical protein
MAQTARVSALLKRSVVAVSTKLSIAVVLGLAAIPLLPHDAASRLGWPGTQTAPIELVAGKRVPLGETSDPTVQLAAARRRQTRERPEPREPEASAAHKNSAISPATEAPANSAADPKSAPKQALTPPASEP